jgi:hypothetical protein
MSTAPDTPAVRPSATGMRQGGRFLLLALPWAAGLYVLGRHITTVPPWAVFLGVVTFSVPVVLSSLYLVTVRKIQYLAGFASQGWIYRLLCRRVLATLGWTAWAIASTFFLLLQFRAYTPGEWLGFFAVIPLFFGTYWLVHRAVRSELKPYRQVADALRIARRITPFVALVVYVAVLQAAGGLPEVGSLGEAIALRRGESAAAPGGSALVYELTQFMAYFDGARLFVSAQVGAQGTAWALAVLALGGWVLFFNAALMLSCFLVPRQEYRRVFARLSDADEPPHPESARVILTSAIATLVVVFVALPTFAALELRARQQAPEITDARAQLETVVVLIDGHPYRPEVLPALEDLQLGVVRQLDELQLQLAASLATAFDRMEANVDPFLDWYYQLSAEYLRTLNLMRGQLQGYVGSKLEAHLQQGDPFGEFKRLLSEAMSLHEELQARFATESAALLARHKLALPDGTPLRIVQEVSLSNAVELPSPDETISFGMRAGTGVITTAVVTKVMAKLYAKGVLKLASQPLAKAALTRAAAVGGGMAGGAAIGSVVPIVGTAAGAVIGAGVGLLAGIGMDYGLLKLEEALGRDEFRAQLLEAIGEVRAELLKDMAVDSASRRVNERDGFP